jgi:hypothetical protein
VRAELTMMAKTVQIHLQLVLVEELAGRRAALHRPEVLAPPSAARVLFKSFFFCAAVEEEKKLRLTIERRVSA